MNESYKQRAEKIHNTSCLKHNSLVGKRINRLTVIGFSYISYGKYKIEYQKDCGHRFYARYYRQLIKASETGCNRCPKKLFVYQGKLESIKEIQKLTGYSHIHGISKVEPGECVDSLVESMRPPHGRQYCQVGNEVLSMSEAARRLGISRQALFIRLKTGWDQERAYTQPRKTNAR